VIRRAGEEEIEPAVGAADAHRVQQVGAARRRVAVDRDLAVRDQVLAHREVRQHRREPGLDLAVRAALAAARRVVDDGVGREDLVEEIPRAGVDRAAVARQLVVDGEDGRRVASRRRT
jgi:hypothetical protein